MKTLHFYHGIYYAPIPPIAGVKFVKLFQLRREFIGIKQKRI